MFNSAVKTVGTIENFMSGAYKEKKTFSLRTDQLEKLSWIPVIGLTISMANRLKAPMSSMVDALPVSAVPIESVPVGIVPGAVTEQVVHAFDPLIELMMAVSLPITSVILTGAALMVLMGFKERGYPMMFSGAIGYVLVNMIPLFIKLLAGIGAAI